MEIKLNLCRVAIGQGFHLLEWEKFTLTFGGGMGIYAHPMIMVSMCY